MNLQLFSICFLTSDVALFSVQLEESQKQYESSQELISKLKGECKRGTFFCSYFTFVAKLCIFPQVLNLYVKIYPSFSLTLSLLAVSLICSLSTFFSACLLVSSPSSPFSHSHLPLFIRSLWIKSLSTHPFSFFPLSSLVLSLNATLWLFLLH